MQEFIAVLLLALAAGILARNFAPSVYWRAVKVFFPRAKIKAVPSCSACSSCMPRPQRTVCEKSGLETD